MPAILRPQAVFADAYQALHADLPHAGAHAARFHRLAARQWILAFDPGIAGNALLAHPRGPSVHRLLKRALLDALLIAPASVLVDQHDPVLRPLIDGLSGTGRQTAGVGAVVTDPLQVEEERLMLRQAAALELPWLVPREPGLIDAFHNGPHRRSRVLVDIHEPPLLVRRNVPDRGLPDLGAGIENGHPFEHPVRRMVLAAHPHVPHLSARVHLLDQLRDLHVVELWIAAVRLGLHVIPPHVLLAL